MNLTEGHNRTHGTEMLGLDKSYFRYIFKKTEKIVCAVFYTTHHIKDSAHTEVLVKDIEDASLRLLNSAHASLAESKEQAAHIILEIQHLLLELESRLRILQAAGYLSKDHLGVFLAEIDSVLRTSNNYRIGVENPLFVEEQDQKMSPREKKDVLTGNVRDTYLTKAGQSRQLPNRRGRILGVLREKGSASIKDISDIIKDCSQKTIQRELNSMIGDNIVVRRGERRWSTYSIA